MTTLTTKTTRRVATSHATSTFTVAIARDWSAVMAEWDNTFRCGQATVFQNKRWLTAWYAAFASQPHIDSLLVTVRDRATNQIALHLPLIRQKLNGLHVVEFADLELTDYNSPLLGPTAPRDSKAATALWRELCRTLRRLPGGVDLIRWRKMPLDLNGKPNPFSLLTTARPCAMNGNLITTGDDFEFYHRSLKRDVRKVLARCWRVFTSDPDAACKIATTEVEGLRFLSALESQQEKRMERLGVNFFLNDEAQATFYRGLVQDGIGEGYAVISALTVGDDIIATLLGVRVDDRYVMLRVGNAGQAWAHCSPGRLVIDRTMAALHQDGVRHFDLSVGDYDYKRRFGAKATPLVDIVSALSWRGLPHVVRDRAVLWLRRRPVLNQRLRQIFGKPV